MKNRVYTTIVLCTAACLAAAAVCTGCASDTGIADNTGMYMMLYDYGNSAVQGAVLTVDGKKAGESDVEGHFMLLLPHKGRYELTVEKPGYELLHDTIWYDPARVLYLKLGNSGQFLDLAEQSLDTGSYDEALSYIGRSLALDPARQDALFLKSIILYKTGDYDQSEQILDTIKTYSENAEYIEGMRKKNAEKK
jgi:tetratricopeptide (TPR) repeat protein